LSNIFRPCSQLISAAPHTEDKTTSDALHISDSCVKRLNEIASDGSYLRIMVEGGGCSGFQYKFDLEKNVKDDDM
jgi:Fe-S cluster assembly iron-binding protein IscA